MRNAPGGSAAYAGTVHGASGAGRAPETCGAALARPRFPCIYIFHAAPSPGGPPHGRRLSLLPCPPGVPRHHAPVRRSTAPARPPRHPAHAAQRHHDVRGGRGAHGAARRGPRDGRDHALAQPAPARRGGTGAAGPSCGRRPGADREAHRRRRAAGGRSAPPLDGCPPARSLHARQRDRRGPAGPPRRSCRRGGRPTFPGSGAIR